MLTDQQSTPQFPETARTEDEDSTKGPWGCAAILFLVVFWFAIGLEVTGKIDIV